MIVEMRDPEGRGEPPVLLPRSEIRCPIPDNRYAQSSLLMTLSGSISFLPTRISTWMWDSSRALRGDLRHRADGIARADVIALIYGEIAGESAVIDAEAGAFHLDDDAV